MAGLRRAAILAVGSELLTPSRLDTNSLFITEQLNLLGIEVVCKSQVGDDRKEIASAPLAFPIWLHTFSEPKTCGEPSPIVETRQPPSKTTAIAEAPKICWCSDGAWCVQLLRAFAVWAA